MGQGKIRTLQSRRHLAKGEPGLEGTRFEAGWPIPADAPTGLYSVTVRVEEKSSGKTRASEKLRGFTVYRKFARIVSVKLDKTFYDVGEPIQSEVAITTAVTPYRRKSIVEQEVDVPIPRPRPRPRPQIIRRQSSLDTFDRRPFPRYGDQYHIPADVPVPLPIRRPRSPPRERDRYREREFEEIRYRDLEPQSFEEYEDIRIRREKSSGPQRRKSAAKSAASTSSSSFEEVETVEKKKKIKVWE